MMKLKIKDLQEIKESALKAIERYERGLKYSLELKDQGVYFEEQKDAIKNFKRAIELRNKAIEIIDEFIEVFEEDENSWGDWEERQYRELAKITAKQIPAAERKIWGRRKIK